MMINKYELIVEAKKKVERLLKETLTEETTDSPVAHICRVIEKGSDSLEEAYALATVFHCGEYYEMSHNGYGYSFSMPSTTDCCEAFWNVVSMITNGYLTVGYANNVYYDGYVLQGRSYAKYIKVV